MKGSWSELRLKERFMRNTNSFSLDDDWYFLPSVELSTTSVHYICVELLSYNTGTTQPRVEHNIALDIYF